MMEHKDLKKLKRTDLLEILLQQNREIERLKQELERAEEQVASRKILIAESGSIAEAALSLNGVFTAAQLACEQYVENVKQRSQQQEEICAEMERVTRAKCDRMIADAQKQADLHWTQVEEKIKQMLDESEDLKKLLSR